jgi:hypothetical protein
MYSRPKNETVSPITTKIPSINKIKVFSLTFQLGITLCFFGFIGHCYLESKKQHGISFERLFPLSQEIFKSTTEACQTAVNKMREPRTL